MSDWKICKLGEIADVKLSNVDKKTNSDEISVRLCNYTDVYKNDFINAHKAETFMVASCNDNEFEKFILRKGQVAITKDSEKRDDIGISTYISEDFEDVVLGYHLSLITPNENHLDGRFLHYWFNTQLAKTYFENNAGGSGQRCTLPIDIIKSIPVHLPEIEIQKRISSILSKLEKKIEINNRINDNLEALAKTIYDYWFVQFDFPDENGKPYKSSGGKMVYNEVLKREIPDGWEVKCLFEIAEFINGLACQKYRPLNEDDDFLPVIKIREMNEGKSGSTEKVRVNIPKKNIIDDGDVLFAWSASLDVKIWTEGKGALNQHIFKVVSAAFPRTFYYFEILNYLQHFKMMAELRKTTMGHITIDHLKTSYITVPPKKLILELDKVIDKLLEKIITSKKQNQQLTQVRDWLLPMLMNGQVSVK